MRAFRVKNRWVHKKQSDGSLTPINKVVSQRDYIGIEKLQKFGFETFDSYNGRAWDGEHTAELYESRGGKWIKLTDTEILELRTLK